MVVTELPNLSPAALPRTHTLHNSPTSELYAAMMEGTPVVVKRTKITSRGEILRFEKEVALLLECSHPNVVQPLAQMRAPPTYAFVMPLFAHGALFGVLHNSGQQLSLRGALSVIADVSSAVTHLHAVGVLHRDVKSDNVLLDGSWRAVLVDFNASERTADIREDIVAPSRPSGGFFKQFVVGTPPPPSSLLPAPRATWAAVHSVTHSVTPSVTPYAGGHPALHANQVGTLPYMAPELLRSARGAAYTERCDVYSCGILANEVLTQTIPYSDAQTEQVKLQTILEARCRALQTTLQTHASRITHHASRLMPHASRLTPHPSPLTPH